MTISPETLAKKAAPIEIINDLNGEIVIQPAMIDSQIRVLKTILAETYSR